MQFTKHALLATFVGSVGCYTGIDGPHVSVEEDSPGNFEGEPDGGSTDEGGSPDDGPKPPGDTSLLGRSGLRRLNANEYDNVIRDILLDDESGAAQTLPSDVGFPFDNDYTAQVVSPTLIEAAELLAGDAADRLLDDPQRRDEVVGCQPTSPGDEACMRQFVTRLGRLALRRPLTDAEVDEFLFGVDRGVMADAEEAGDFHAGVHTFVRAILQDPEFLYRVEIGVPVEGDDKVFKLTSNEMATRLSFLFWGSTPALWLLDIAEDDGLQTAEEINAIARMMLEDPRAVDRVDRFHALWLGYSAMTFSGALADSMRVESRALLQRVLFDEDRPWRDVFTLTETYANDALAEHYDLPLPGSSEPQWVSYDTTGRGGLLSHGTFLSVDSGIEDTSPVARGMLVRTRLLCQTIPPPPPGVVVDETPPGGVCKEERYATHREKDGGCKACHMLMDPIGFGLEAYDAIGRFRGFEPDREITPDEDESQCPISGDGELDGVAFNGPLQLGELAVEAGLVQECVVTQLYRYAMGVSELDAAETAFVSAAVDRVVADDDFRFGDLLVDFVTQETFGYRKEE